MTSGNDHAAGAVDWAAAVRTGRRMAPTGPAVTAAEAAQAVRDLHASSANAELVVRRVTGLGAGLPVAPATVVDRPGWIEATAEGMAILTAPLTGKITPRRAARTVAGAQIGSVLGLLSGRVLGQFDPVPLGGRLLLVAPNVIKVERELGADPTDFRLWVCLHESTHRLQFTAVPWLRGHFMDLVAEFGALADTDASALVDRISRAVRGGKDTGSSWIEAIQTPAQREVFDRLMALMSLLEGHADHVMDAAGPQVVPTVAEIRRAFSRRRSASRGPIDRLLRSVLGMQVKISQYIKGEAFVSAVVAAAGMDGFNRVWATPQTLPTRAEIADPDAWMARVLHRSPSG